MSERELIKKTIKKNSPRPLAIREWPWYHRHTERRSLNYEWCCRRCLTGNKIESFEEEPLLHIICEKCGLMINRDEPQSEWYYFI